MRIKLLTCYSGADFTANAGEETDKFSAAEAIRMIENGTAVPVAPPVERAVKTVAETRAEPSDGGSKRKRR